MGVKWGQLHRSGAGRLRQRHADPLGLYIDEKAFKDKFRDYVLQLPKQRRPCNPEAIPNLRERVGRVRQNTEAQGMRPADYFPQGHQFAKTRQIPNGAAGVASFLQQLISHRGFYDPTSL